MRGRHSLLSPLSLWLSQLECSSPAGFARRVNHALSTPNTHPHSVGRGPVQPGLPLFGVFTGMVLSRGVEVRPAADWWGSICAWPLKSVIIIIQHGWRKWASSYWNAIHSQYCTCNSCWRWRHSSELWLTNGQLKCFWQQRRGYSKDGASKAIQWLDMEKCLTGIGTKPALFCWPYILSCFYSMATFEWGTLNRSWNLCKIHAISILAFSCTQGQGGLLKGGGGTPEHSYKIHGNS